VGFQTLSADLYAAILNLDMPHVIAAEVAFTVVLALAVHSAAGVRQAAVNWGVAARMIAGRFMPVTYWAPV